MKRVQLALVIFGAFLISACTGVKSSNEVEALNNIEAVGSPFTRLLADEYRTYANREHYEMFDYADALHFARKGIAAANGEDVMPETLADWDLSDTSLSDLLDARGQLIDILENGGREMAADKSALAQARFDCWVEQQEENWQTDEINSCKEEFFSLIGELKVIVVPVMPEPEVTEELPTPVTETVAEETLAPLEQALFIVFFDWSKSGLSTGAEEVLDAVAEEVKKRDDISTIVVTAHTDSSGATKFNQKLSMKRGNSVRNSLIARGIDKNLIRIEAKGENDMLVKTDNNVREPANRRAQISLQ